MRVFTKVYYKNETFFQSLVNFQKKILILSWICRYETFSVFKPKGMNFCDSHVRHLLYYIEAIDDFFSFSHMQSLFYIYDICNNNTVSSLWVLMLLNLLLL